LNWLEVCRLPEVILPQMQRLAVIPV